MQMHIIGTVRIVYGAWSTVSVPLSVPVWFHSSKLAAAGLLLWARRAGAISRSLPGVRQQRRTAGECG